MTDTLTDAPTLKQRICDIGKWLYDARLIVSGDGNISARLDDGDILVTPSGACKGMLTPEMLVVTNADGAPKGAGRPSTEFKMHLEIYRRRPDVRAVVHAHPPTATGFSVAGMALDQAVLPELMCTIGGVPLAPFSVPSTNEVPDHIGPLIETANAVMLANHGVTTVGGDLMEAYHRMETVEHYARILLTARLLGHVGVLTSDQAERIAQAAYGGGVLPGWPCRTA